MKNWLILHKGGMDKFRSLLASRPSPPSEMSLVSNLPIELSGKRSICALNRHRLFYNAFSLVVTRGHSRFISDHSCVLSDKIAFYSQSMSRVTSIFKI